MNTDIQYEWLIRRNNVPFICPLLWSSVSAPPLPPSRVGFPALRQLQVSLSGTFYLQLNSAPPPPVASSTGSALLSTKQMVNSRFMSSGCNISTTHTLNMFLHEVPNSDKGGFAAVLQLLSRRRSGCWLIVFLLKKDIYILLLGRILCLKALQILCFLNVNLQWLNCHE